MPSFASSASFLVFLKNQLALRENSLLPFQTMFMPTTKEELNTLGWDIPDIIIVTGDTYIDSPFIGVAVIGKHLIKHGFKVAVIAQPSIHSSKDIIRLGEPRLFWGVTAGSIDSTVANYTASRKYRRQDDFTPGGMNNRPNRASIVYCNLIRKYFKNTKPVVLGGLEASLRRIAHFDVFDSAVRRSILPDSKADVLVYGMAEKTIVELAQAFRDQTDWKGIAGICYMAGQAVPSFHRLPSYESVRDTPAEFLKMSIDFHRFAGDTAVGFIQKHGNRFLVHNPPQKPVTSDELDQIYEMDFEHDVHPFYKTGKVKALDTIRQSVTAHRGCFGQCHFCAIAVHQGKQIISRTPKSIIREITKHTKKPGFNGIIYDIGGPTANMYGTKCKQNWKCRNKRCLQPRPCPNLIPGHKTQMDILSQITKIPGVKKVFVSSGIRHDLVMIDEKWRNAYIEQLVRYHISGQIKVAPEHSEESVLRLMNKPSVDTVLQFKKLFANACRKFRKRYFLTYYLMAAHPGCSPQNMRRLNAFLINRLKTIPEQIQIFTPTPATLSTAMYHCETDLQGNRIYCDKTVNQMARQKQILRNKK